MDALDAFSRSRSGAARPLASARSAGSGGLSASDIKKSLNLNRSASDASVLPAPAAEDHLVDAAAVVEGLVREYLSKHAARLPETCRAFNEEWPRDSAKSVTNRNVLRRALGVERYVAKLKKAGKAAPESTLEALVAYQAAKVQATGGSGAGGEATSPTKQATAKASPRDAAGSPPPPRAPKVAHWGSVDLNDEDRALLEGAGGGGPPAMGAQQPPPQAMGVRAPPPMQQAASALDEMLMEDFGEDELDAAAAPVPAMPKPSVRRMESMGGGSGASGGAGALPSGPSLDAAAAKEIKTLIFGRHGGAPPASWKQGFFFSLVGGIEYGLVQLEGGPCGILASVQAHTLHAILDDAGRVGGSQSPKAQRSALAQGLARTLWQAGGLQAATLVTCSAGVSTAGLSADAVLQSCACARFSGSRSDLEAALDKALPQYMEERGHGLLLFLVSLVLSKGGPKAVRAEMDEPEGALMAAHGYCSQDLVNLVLCGHSVSNVFDGNKHMDEMVLHGVPERSPVGLLTLFEWYGSLDVGDNLKKPRAPVWVVQSESHFTCLFSVATALPRAAPFDLGYYDGLANQDAPILLTMSKSPTGGHSGRLGTMEEREKKSDDLTPPLEYVIETRWPGVAVDWNGTDPIL